MKHRHFSMVLAGVALALGAATVQAEQHHHDRGQGGHGPAGHRGHDGEGRRDWHGSEGRRDWHDSEGRRDWRRESRHERDFRGPPPHARHPGAGPRHAWVRGGYVPAPYRGYTYVVNDWRGHRLYAPPRGYRWIQYGGDYLLIAIGTGLIANIVFAY